MRRLILALTALLAMVVAPSARAACAGENLLDQLAAADPGGHERLFEQAHAMPNGTGRLWEVTGGGGAPSYLFGTYHTQQARRTVPSEIWPLLQNARIAVFELTLDEQDAMQARLGSDPAFAFDADATPLSERLPAEHLAVLAEALAARGVTLEAAERMRPWLLFTILAFPACHLQAVAAGAEPLDKLMALRAREFGVPERGLETYEQALDAFRRIRPARFLEMLVDSGEMVGIEEDIYQTTLDLYAAGEVAAVGEFSILLSERAGTTDDPRQLYDEVMAELLDARNRAWVPALVEEIGKGNAFISVGALHLPGEVGLIELLRGQGLTLTLIAD